MHALDSLFGWLLRASWQASVLVALVLAAQWLFRTKLSPAWRFALWLLVLARLVMPQSLQSPVSIFNVAHWRAPVPVAFRAPARPVAAADQPTAPTPSGAAVSTSSTGSSTAVNSGPRVSPPAVGVITPTPSLVDRLRASLPFIWLAGAVGLLLRMVWQNFRFARRVLRQRQVTQTDALEALEDGKQSMGLRTPLTVIETPEVRSPALYGFVRPRLVLPQGTLAGFGRQELYYIFLHELAHVKRWDMALNWLISGLRTLHWFNPVLWFAFRRMDADREVAADALALTHAPAGGRQLYGETIIKLLERYTQPAAIAGLVGILEDRQQMTRRITMIAQFKRMIPWSAPAAGLFLVLGVITLTDAQTEKITNAKLFTSSNAPSVKILLSGTSSDVTGVLSPDETAVAYINWPDAKGGDLVVRDLRTGVSKIVVAASPAKNGMEYPESPVWSADSRSIAYCWWTNHADDGSVRVVSREGGEPKVICKQAWFWLFDWSKDGKQLVGDLGGSRLWDQKPETANSGASRLAVLDVESDAFHIIEPGGGQARFSPDGRFIVCEKTLEGKRHVFLMSSDGTHVTPLSTGAWEDSAPAFSADGRLVLLSSDRRGSWDLWGIPIDQGNVAGEPFPLRYDFGDHRKWITSSGKLAFRNGGGGVDIYEVSAMQSPGGAETQPRRISRGAFGNNMRAVWSADGRMLAYVRPGPRNKHPMLCIQSGGTEQLYDPRMIRVGRLFWSPDGQTIGMAGWSDEAIPVYGVHFFSLASHARTTDRVARMTDQSVGGMYWLGYSADGREFNYFDFHTGKRVVVTIATKARREISLPDEFTKGRSTLLTATPSWAGRPESWDDSSVVYVRKAANSEQELVVADSDWKNPRVVARVTAPGSITQARLSPDRTKIAFGVLPGGAAKTQLHVKAIDGTWERVVDTANKSPGNFNWSPDATRLAVELDEKLPSEIGILENFLPPEKLAAK